MSHSTEIWNKRFIKHIIDNPSESSKYLAAAFNWRTTPQGDEYWREKTFKGLPIYDEDISFLKSLVGIKDDPFLLDPENKEFC